MTTDTAPAVLQEARQRAQEALDALWQPGATQRTSSRSRAYFWLANRLRIKSDECHVELFDLERCREAEKACKLAHGPAAFQLGRI